MIDDRETNPYATPEDVGGYSLRSVIPAHVRRVIWFYRQTIIALVAWVLWGLTFLFFYEIEIIKALIPRTLQNYFWFDLNQSFLILSILVIWIYSIYVVLKTFGSMRYKFFSVFLLTLLCCWFPPIVWAVVIAARIAAYKFLKRHCERVGFWSVQMRPETKSEVDF